MDYKMIALDLDGTLTNSEKKISARTRDVLIDIQKQGAKVVLATGRPINGAVELSRELEMDVYGGYILAFNGGLIQDCRTGIYSGARRCQPEISGSDRHLPWG